MRIIAGTFRGKKILEPKDTKTRPLKDLTKESIFNILNHSNKFEINLKKSNILDLFSGVGSFGIECLSRGVKKVIFYRNFFNKGILCTKYDYPEYLSFRYDEGKFITSDRSDTVFGDPVEWKLKKGAYYTAHILHQHRVIPDKFKSYEWVQGADNVLVVESLRKLKRYSIAARKRHEDFKRKSKRS